MGKQRRRVFARLLSLGVLTACLCYVAQQEGVAQDEYTCDQSYFLCYSQTFGDPNKTCISAAESCMMSHARPSLFRGPICEPSGRDIDATCLRGDIHTWDGSYPDLAPYFEACMANGAEMGDVDSKACCLQTANYFTALYCP